MRLPGANGKPGGPGLAVKQAFSFPQHLLSKRNPYPAGSRSSNRYPQR